MNWWDQGAAKKLPKAKKEESGISFTDKVHSIDEIENLYTPEEAASVLRCTVGTLGKWKSQGIIKGTKQGRNTYYTAQQIADCRKERELQWQKLKRKAFGSR